MDEPTPPPTATPPVAGPPGMPPPSLPPSPLPPSPPARRGGLGRLLLRGVALGLAVLCGLLLGVLAWLGTESGLHFVVGQAEDRLNTAGTTLRIEEAGGSLYRGIRIGQVHYAGGGLEVKGQGLVVRYTLLDLLERRVSVAELSADAIELTLPPSEADPPPRRSTPMPGSFALPVAIALDRLAVGRLTIHLPPGQAAGAPPAEPSSTTAAPPPAASPPAGPAPIVIDGLSGRLTYLAGQYRLDQLAVGTPWGRIDGGALQLAAEPPHALTAALDFAGEVERLVIRARLEADGDLESARARVAGRAAEADVRIDARLAPLAVMPLAQAQVTLKGFDARRLAPLVGPQTRLPETAIDADLSIVPGAAPPAAVPADTMPTAWSGEIRLTNASAGALGADRLPLRSLAAAVELVDVDDAGRRTIRARDLKVVAPAATAGTQASLGGEITVTPGRPIDLAGIAIPGTRAALRFEAIDVAQFAAQLPPTALDGRLDLDEKTFLLDLRQTAERMRALLPATMARAVGDAEVFARGQVGEQAVTLAEARVRLGAARLTAAGEVGIQAPRRLAFKGTLRDIELDPWLPADLGIDPRWRSGRIGADWSVDGHLEPAVDARIGLALVDSRIGGQPLALELNSQVRLEPDGMPARLDRTRLDLRLGKNRLTAQGALGRAGDRLALELALVDPGALDDRLGGRLALDGALTGAFDRLRASAAIRGDRLRFAGPDGEIQVQSVRIDANGPAVARVPPDAPLGAKIVVRGAKLPAATIDVVDLAVDGSLNAHRFTLSTRGLGETLALAGTGRATLAGPPQWTARLASLSVDGRVPLRLTAPADLRLTADRLRIDRFNARVADGTLDLVRLLADWSGTPSFDAAGSLSDLSLARLLALAGQKPDGELLKPLAGLRLGGAWTLKGSGPADLDGDVRLDLREVATADGLGLTGANGARVRFERGRLDGRVDLKLPSLAFTRPFTGPDITIDGALALAGSVGGTTTDPRWDLRLTGDGITLLQRSVGWRLTDGALAARLVGREVRVETLRMTSGEGKVEVQGQARLFDDPKQAPAGSLPMEGHFDLTSTRFHVPIGPGQRVTLSGRTTLSSGTAGTVLNGDLRADNGLIEIQGSAAPTLPDDVRVIDERPGAKPVAAKPAKPAKPADGGAEAEAQSPIRIRTDLGIDLGDQLRLTGNGLVARLTGKLRLGGTLPNDPQMRGVVNVVDGAYRAYGQDLKIEKGVVRFNGPIDNPALDIEARRPFLPVQVGVAITGTALKPVVALVSSPDMSQTDKLSWLVLGTDPKDAPAAAQSLLLQQAAVNLLSDDDGSYKPGIAERLGLDVINFGYGSDIGPAQGVVESALPTGLPRRESSTTNSTPQEVVTLGKRFGNRLFVSYEQGVRSVWNLLRLQYTLTERLSARVQTGSDNALDLLYSWSFD